MIESGYARAACTCARSALATPDTTPPALQCPALPPRPVHCGAPETLFIETLLAMGCARKVGAGRMHRPLYQRRRAPIDPRPPMAWAQIERHVERRASPQMPLGHLWAPL